MERQQHGTLHCSVVPRTNSTGLIWEMESAALNSRIRICIATSFPRGLTCTLQMEKH